MIEYIEKTGIITHVGEARNTFANGAPVMVKDFVGRGQLQDVQGVNIGVKFDFDEKNWYTGNFTQKTVDQYIQKGKQLNAKTWVKESNGKTYYNFAVIYPKKPDAAAIEGKLNPMIQDVERLKQQVTSLHAMLTEVKSWQTKHDTTTMFDEDAPFVHPAEARALNGGMLPKISSSIQQLKAGQIDGQQFMSDAERLEYEFNNQEQPPLDAYDNGDMNPNYIPF